jgi:hypothetical protein
VPLKSGPTDPEATLNSPVPPLEYLLSCSTKSLQELELCALNRSQQCLRAAKEEWEEALAQREMAGVARWFIEHRPYLLEIAQRTLQAEFGQGVLAFPERGPQLLPTSESKPSGEESHTLDKISYPAMRKYSHR